VAKSKQNHKCPTWVVYSCSAYGAIEFLSTEIPLTTISEKYQESLFDFYSAVNSEIVYTFANNYLQVLSQTDESNAVGALTDYTFFLINFSNSHSPRKRKGLLGSYTWLEPVDIAIYDSDDATTHFQAFLASRRQGRVTRAPVGWKPTDEEGFDSIANIMEQEIDPLAFLSMPDPSD